MKAATSPTPGSGVSVPRRRSPTTKYLALGVAKSVPWVRYYPQEWLTRLASVSPSAELAHRRLADLVWAGGEWPPSDPAMIGRLARCDPSAIAATVQDLGFLGWFSRGGRLQNAAVAGVRKDAVKALNARRTGGRNGARNRWSPSPHAQAIAEPWVSHSKAIAEPCLSHSNALTEVCRLDDKTINSTSKAINTAERLTLSGSAREMPATSPEEDFLDEVTAVLEGWKAGSSVSELGNWGGWWRNKFRKNAKKAQAVLNDVRSLVKERRITQCPGKAAVDLWKRLP